MYRFKKSIRTEKLENPLYNVHDPIGVKLLSCLRLHFTHLSNHKFRHGFSYTVNPMGHQSGTDVKTCKFHSSKTPLVRYKYNNKSLFVQNLL